MAARPYRAATRDHARRDESGIGADLARIAPAWRGRESNQETAYRHRAKLLPGMAAAGGTAVSGSTRTDCTGMPGAPAAPSRLLRARTQSRLARRAGPHRPANRKTQGGRPFSGVLAGRGQADAGGVSREPEGCIGLAKSCNR